MFADYSYSPVLRVATFYRIVKMVTSNYCSLLKKNLRIKNPFLGFRIMIIWVMLWGTIFLILGKKADSFYITVQE